MEQKRKEVKGQEDCEESSEIQSRRDDGALIQQQSRRVRERIKKATQKKGGS